MKRKYLITLCLIGVSIFGVYYLISGKHYNFPISLYPNEFEVSKLMGATDQSCVVTDKTDRFTELKKIFFSEVEGWSIDFKSYSPEYSLWSDQIIIDVVKGGAVVNFKTNLFGWVQMSKSFEIVRVLGLLENICTERI